MSYKILGIEVERKTDILAFAAFVLSIGSIVTQGISLIKGPKVVLIQPRQVLINGEKYSDGKTYTKISAKMIYLNKGSPGYDDITKSEQTIIFVGDDKIKLIAQDYIESSAGDENQIIIDKKSDADPVQIKSGAVVAHETYFSPWPNSNNNSSNFVEIEDFIKKIELHDEIKVEFKTNTFGGSILTQKCFLVTNEFLGHLKRKGWSAPVCKLIN